MKSAVITIFIMSMLSGMLPAYAEPEQERTNQRPPEAAVLEALNRIILPEVSFRQAHIQEVIEYLIEASREFDPENEGVNIILNLHTPPSAEEREKRPREWTFFFDDSEQDQRGTEKQDVPPVTFTARQISLQETLRIVTELTNLRYRLRGNVVFVEPRDAPDGEITVRVYDVMPTIEERIRDIKEDL